MTQYLLLGRHQRFLEWDEVEVPEEPAVVEPEPAPVVQEIQATAPALEPSPEEALYERLRALLAQLNRCY